MASPRVSERPAELRHNPVNTWSHHNSDQPVRHSHGLKISRFVQTLDQFECGNCIQDKFTVTVGDKPTSWELRIYPNGYEEDTAAYLALFVKHKEGSTCKYMLKASICILDTGGNKKVTCELPGKVLSSKQMHGTKKYILREQLMSNPQVYFNDSLTFLIEAEICLPDSNKVCVVENEDAAEEALHAEDDLISGEITARLQADYSGLLKSGQHSDVVIKVGGETIPCHKAVLAARSPVFSAMFQHNMAEARSHEVDIPDLAPSTVHLMLDYIYSGAFKHNSTTEELLPAADKYELTQLKTACELSLGRNINLTNCVDLLILADTHSAAQLQRSCLQFTVDNLAKIMSSLTGKSKLSAHPAIMAQILQVIIKGFELPFFTHLSFLISSLLSRIVFNRLIICCRPPQNKKRRRILEPKEGRKNSRVLPRFSPAEVPPRVMKKICNFIVKEC